MPLEGADCGVWSERAAASRILFGAEVGGEDASDALLGEGKGGGLGGGAAEGGREAAPPPERSAACFWLCLRCGGAGCLGAGCLASACSNPEATCPARDASLDAWVPFWPASSCASAAARAAEAAAARRREARTSEVAFCVRSISPRRESKSAICGLEGVCASIQNEEAPTPSTCAQGGSKSEPTGWTTSSVGGRGQNVARSFGLNDCGSMQGDCGSMQGDCGSMQGGRALGAQKVGHRPWCRAEWVHDDRTLKYGEGKVKIGH
eukprot:4557357-Pleurochrysis_carterae.AAC.3